MAQYPNNYSSKKKRTGWLVGCGVGAVIIICGIGFLIFGGFAGLIAIFGGEPEGLTVVINQPSAALNVGEFFEIGLELANDGPRNIRITEIQLPNELLANTIVTGVDQGGVLGMDYGSRTAYNFDFVIAPNGREQVTFQFQAINDGNITGEIGVPVGTRTNNSRIRLVVSTGEIAVIPEDDPLPPVGEVIPYQSVVQIIALVESGGQLVEAWSGSGTIITEDGLILTNEHVVLDPYVVVADLLVAVTVQQDQAPVPMFYADVLQADYYLDLAVIKIRSDLLGNPVDLDALGIEPVTIGSSDELQLGDPMVIIGYPGIGGQTITLTRGEVSGFTAEAPYGNRAFIKTSATIAGGNSGGLAATPQGVLVGVPTQLGSGDLDAGFVDCRFLVDTNRDGVIDENDHCIPLGGFINAIRPIALALPLIEAAQAGQVAIVGPYVQEYEEVEMGGELLLEEYFIDNTNDWLVYSDFDGSIKIDEGNLIINLDDSHDLLFTWMINNYYDDPVLSTYAYPIVSTGDGEFGLICLNLDYDLIIVFQISEDGWYSIVKYDGDRESYLTEWTYSEYVDQTTDYYLAAYCGSEGVAFALNDVLLADVYEPINVPLQVGVSAGTYEIPGFMMGFEVFFIGRP